MNYKSNILIICIIAFIKISYASIPYYFYFNYVNTGDYYSYIINGVNLETGQKEFVIDEDYVNGYPFVLSDNSKIFFQCGDEIWVYNTQDESIDTLSHLGKIEEISNVAFIPLKNEVFLSFVKMGAKIVSDENHELEHTYISIDKNDYSIIDTINVFSTIKSVISADGKKIYEMQDLKNEISFQCRNLTPGPFNYSTNIIEGFENLQLQDPPYFIDAANGYVLVGYLSGNNGHLVLCDPENKTSISKLILPIGEPPFEKGITPNGDIIFEGEENLYIFSGQTVLIKQRIRVPISSDPNIESKIFILGDSLYYFPEDPKEYAATIFDNIRQVDLTTIQSDTSLVDMMIDDVNESYQKDRISTKSTADKYVSYFENTNIHLAQNDYAAASVTLDSVLQDLDQDNGVALTNDVYSLIKYNTAILRERLKILP